MRLLIHLGPRPKCHHVENSGQHNPAVLSTRDQAILISLRWRILWQDSLLSITFDRAPSSFVFSAQSQQVQTVYPTPMSYIQCMKSLCSSGLHIVQERSVSSDMHWEPTNMMKIQEELMEIRKNAVPHLRDVTSCRSIKDQLEHWCFDLHISFFTSELFRPLLKHQKPNTEQMGELRDICINSLAKTVNAFLGLQNVAASVRTSWAVLQKALSSALMLSILQEPLRDDRMKSLLDRFMGVMDDLNTGLDPSELPAPLSRSISALHRLLALPSNSNLSARGIISHVSAPEEGDEPSSSKLGKSPKSQSSQSSGSPYTTRDSIMWGSTSSGQGMQLD